MGLYRGRLLSALASDVARRDNLTLLVDLLPRYHLVRADSHSERRMDAILQALDGLLKAGDAGHIG